MWRVLAIILLMTAWGCSEDGEEETPDPTWEPTEAPTEAPVTDCTEPAIVPLADIYAALGIE